MCCYCMNRIKINLEACHLSLGTNKPLRLVESINCFFLLKLDFAPDDANLLKKTL